MKVIDEILLALRGTGDISVKRLSILTGIPKPQVYQALYRLRQKGLAVQKKTAVYDVTDRGRQRANEMIKGPLFKQEKQKQ